MRRVRANRKRKAHGLRPVGSARKAHGSRPVGRDRVRRRPALDSGLRALDPSGFTLVEMLVAVALVVLMMSMFATVFQLAAGSINTQRGIAENDQRARSVTIVLRGDLNNRSFQLVTPFDADETPPGGTDPDFNLRDFTKREGYFYISENDPDDDTDDVLQFTVKLPGTTGDFYVGKATTLAAAADFADSNEPDRDDGNPTPDDASDSIAAEVSYFLRHGRLYRRVLLLRDPLVDGDPTQPETNEATPRRYFDPDNGLYSGNFWNDYDLSAHFSANGAELNGVEDLSNEGTVFFPLGNPRNRFGHSRAHGLPREYVGTANDEFIGRFTHQETSDTRFQYPLGACVDSSGATLGNGNPMDWYSATGETTTPTTTDLTLANGVVQEFDSGERRAEDLLLPNVHAFDVKVWDDALERFVDVGHSIAGGDYNQANNAHASASTPILYGPSTTAANNRVFDTWHPSIDIDGGGNDPAPFRPLNTAGEPTPLQAIQITIRYLDVASNQMRQLTLQVSLLD